MNLGRIATSIEDFSNRLGFEVSLRRVRRSSANRRIVYFLHIGKAAGSQVKQMAVGQQVKVTPVGSDKN